MIVPTVASLAEDALSAVPLALRQGSLAMGANRMQTTLRVVFPAALSGVAAAVVLGMSRAIGETMIVALAAGAQKNLALDPREGMQTMTGFIAQTAGGENPVGSRQYNTLFAVGLLLFADHAGHQHDQHHLRPPLQAGVLMSTCHRATARETVRTIATGKSRDRSVGSLVFLVAAVVLAVLRRDGARRADRRHRARGRRRASTRDLLTDYESTITSRGDRLPGRHPRDACG